ncbi:cell wall-binding protein, partial [Clostridioides difficile]|nr:cell wall-binding protein [Clostridioides difficile]
NSENELDRDHLGFKIIDNKTYYYDEASKLVKGLININNSLFYFDPIESNLVTGWQTINGKKYYFDINTGAASTSYKIINGKHFYFNNNGVMQLGVFKGPDGFEYFAPANTQNNNIEGQAIVYQSKFLTLNGKKYYFDNDSKAVTGWQTIDGKKYYFNLNTAEAATGWQTIDGKKYYFNTNTSIASTGYTIINGKHFYFNTDGIMQIGVFKGPNGFEYFAPANTDANNIEGQAIRYQNRFLYLHDNIYYFGNNSKAVTGWQTINGNVYYFMPDTAMAAAGGLFEIDGVIYFFGVDGVKAPGIYG